MKVGGKMNVLIMTLVFVFCTWLMTMGTIVLTYSVLKRENPTIIETIKEKVQNKEIINQVEIVTDEMEADTEEGVINEYYTRF